jgi:hypothetical protein
VADLVSCHVAAIATPGSVLGAVVAKAATTTFRSRSAPRATPFDLVSSPASAGCRFLGIALIALLARIEDTNTIGLIVLVDVVTAVAIAGALQKRDRSGVADLRGVSKLATLRAIVGFQ